MLARTPVTRRHFRAPPLQTRPLKPKTTARERPGPGLNSDSEPLAALQHSDRTRRSSGEFGTGSAPLALPGFTLLSLPPPTLFSGPISPEPTDPPAKSPTAAAEGPQADVRERRAGGETRLQPRGPARPRPRGRAGPSSELGGGGGVWGWGRAGRGQLSDLERRGSGRRGCGVWARRTGFSAQLPLFRPQQPSPSGAHGHTHLALSPPRAAQVSARGRICRLCDRRRRDSSPYLVTAVALLSREAQVAFLSLQQR